MVPAAVVMPSPFKKDNSPDVEEVDVEEVRMSGSTVRKSCLRNAAGEKPTKLSKTDLGDAAASAGPTVSDLSQGSGSEKESVSKKLSFSDDQSGFLPPNLPAEFSTAGSSGQLVLEVPPGFPAGFRAEQSREDPPAWTGGNSVSPLLVC